MLRPDFQHLLAHLVAQEAGLAGDGRSIDGTGNVTDETAGDARIEDDGDVAAGIDLARVDALDGALAGAAADQLRIVEIGGIEAAVEIVVALHLRALAGDDADRAAETAGHVAAGKTVGGDEHEATHARRCAGAGGVGDALDIERRLFHFERRFAQRVGRYIGRVIKFEVGIGFRQISLVRKAGERIFGRDPGHGDGALGKHLHVEARIGRDAGDLLADKDAKREIVALGSFRALDLAETDADGAGTGTNHDRIRLIRSRGLGEINQLAGTGKQFGGIDFRGHDCKPFILVPFIVHCQKHQGRLADSDVPP